jgi:ankyrin repeat protein
MINESSNESSNGLSLLVAPRHESATASIVTIENVVSPEAVNVNTLLHAVELPSGTDFMALIEKLSPKALSRVLVIQNKLGETLLHMAAEFQSEKNFIALIEKVSSDALSQALVKQNKHGETPLHVAALRRALVIESDYDNTLLHMAVELPSGTDFMTLIEKLSPDALNKALVIPDDYGNTPLHVAARYQSATDFIALIEKVSPEALSQALVIQNKHGETPLHGAARYQSANDVIIALLKIDLLEKLKEPGSHCLPGLILGSSYQQLTGGNRPFDFDFLSAWKRTHQLDSVEQLLLACILSDTEQFFDASHPVIDGSDSDQFDYWLQRKVSACQYAKTAYGSDDPSVSEAARNCLLEIKCDLQNCIDHCQAKLMVDCVDQIQSLINLCDIDLRPESCRGFMGRDSIAVNSVPRLLFSLFKRSYCTDIVLRKEESTPVFKQSN